MLEKKKLIETASSSNLSNSSKSSRSPTPANDLANNKLNLNATASSSFKSAYNVKPAGLGNNPLSNSSSNNYNSSFNSNKISAILNSNQSNSINQSN